MWLLGIKEEEAEVGEVITAGPTESRVLFFTSSTEHSVLCHLERCNCNATKKAEGWANDRVLPGPLPSSFLDSYYDSLLLLSTPLPHKTLPNTFTGRRQPRWSFFCRTSVGVWTRSKRKRHQLLLEIGNDSRIRGTFGEECLARASTLGTHKGRITSPSTL